MTWYTTGVLYLPAQLLVPLLIASIFWILSALLKFVSQILAQPSAYPASNLISASVKEWSTGLMKWMVILLFTSERDRIFLHISLPVSSKCCLWDTFFEQFSAAQITTCSSPLTDHYQNHILTSGWSLPWRFIFLSYLFCWFSTLGWQWSLLPVSSSMTIFFNYPKGSLPHRLKIVYPKLPLSLLLTTHCLAYNNELWRK